MRRRRCETWRAALRRVLRSDSQACSWARACLGVGVGAVENGGRSGAGGRFPTEVQLSGVEPRDLGGAVRAVGADGGGARAVGGLAVVDGEAGDGVVEPGGAALVGEAGDDQVVAGAGEGDVEEAALLGFLLALLVGLGGVPALGLEAADLEPAFAGGVADDDVRGRGAVGQEVGDDDDRVLEALGLVDGEDLDLGAGLLAHRRVALFAAGLGLLLEEADHRAQGGGAGGLVGAGDVEHLPEVGDALLAGGAQAEGGQGAGLVEEGGDHLARRLHAAAAVERLEDGEGAADEVGVLDALADGGQRVQDAAARHELEDVVVGEAEEGRAEGGEDGEAVGRVVDGAQDGGEGLHLFAGVVLLAADEAVRDAVGLERLLERADELAASSCGRAGRRRRGARGGRSRRFGRGCSRACRG